MKGRVLPSVGESGIIHVQDSSHASQSPAANYVVTECTEFKTWQVFYTNRAPLRSCRLIYCSAGTAFSFSVYRHAILLKGQERGNKTIFRTASQTSQEMVLF